MPLFVVRMPDLRCALVSARSDVEVAHIIDEIMDPSLCTWSRYHGPVWVDFQLPIEVETQAEGPLEVRRIRRRDWPLVPHLGEGETASEMCSQLVRRAFPAIADAWSDPEEIDRPTLLAALRKDGEEHARSIDAQSTTPTEHGAPIVVTSAFFLHERSGTFRRVSDQLATSLTRGEAAAPRGHEGEVRLVLVEVPKPRTSCDARVTLALRLGLDATRHVVPAHRADAFRSPTTANQPGADRFHERRNAAVRWRMSSGEQRSLVAAVKRAFPRIDQVRFALR